MSYTSYKTYFRKMTEKTRLDIYLFEKGFATSRQRAQAIIMAGKVRVNDRLIDKPGRPVLKNDKITLIGKDLPFVSRGGLKLEKALHEFQVNVAGWTCLDVGASTGGFTDCLLQNGAEHVYAVDVGYGQLAWKLREDPKVTVIERTNIRHMNSDKLPSPVDLATIDVSFISLKTVVPAVLKFLKNSASIIALIKPQFEIGKDKVGKGGVVRNPDHHQEVIENLTTFFVRTGLDIKSLSTSPIKGPKGNIEFLIHMKTCLA
jgi:23S rRNA (cytidine1920-2'-O)/16S rRNA (cytidine1409-2'-O)-methyltransferase